ncbi:MAG: hypothetical protein JW844_02435 [Candidatus Omnitrophica bacterium]|nr:hypothetical protein [Candidatus Omnitrophota bacterium]
MVANTEAFFQRWNGAFYITGGGAFMTLKKLFYHIIVCVGLTMTCLIPTAYGLTMIEMGIEELALRADCIVLARCIAKRDVWDPYVASVETFVTLHVDEYWKNHLGTEELTIRHINNYIDIEEQDAYDGLTFLPDEEAVLFLTGKDPEGYRHVLGLAQGKILITQEEPGTANRLSRDLDGIIFHDLETGKLYQKKEEVMHMSLDELRQSISGFVLKERLR